MRRILFVAMAMLALMGCNKFSKLSFEDIDYFKAYDEINHSSSTIDYLILEFDGVNVKFSEAYYDKDSKKGWFEKTIHLLGGNNMMNTPYYSDKSIGTYIRNGNEITFKGLVATNRIGARLELSKAEIRGEKAGTINIDVYYNSVSSLGIARSGKINFVGHK